MAHEPMNRTALITLGIRTLLIAWVLLMAFLTNLAWPALFLLAVLGCSLLLPDIASQCTGKTGTWAAIAAWLSSLLLPTCLFNTTKSATFADTYYAVLAWLIVAAIALTSRRVEKIGLKRLWKILAMFWAYSGALLWLAAAYMQDLSGTFYVGLVLAGFALVVTMLWFRLPASCIVGLNTGLLILVLLPIVDFLTRPPRRIDPHPEVAGNAYLYDVAKKDPHAFLYWWGKYLGQYDKLMRELFIADPAHVLPCRIRTNSQTTFFQSHIHINSLGFRGKEIAREKGNAYRIVAMGESTTFGFTITPDHLPWPEFLEQSIHERIPSERPVEVINTGLPHHNLEFNLYRLQTEILALKPDMIISYHGWNGFRWLYPSLPPIFEKHYPLFEKRPLHLLAECEFRLKMFIFKRRLATKPVLDMPSISQLLETKFAHVYRELIDIARTNNIRLVLGNYSMAVDGKSDRNVCEFYREVFPSVYPAIKVNVMHTTLVKELVRQHPEVIYADTNPGLDGEYRKFIDLVHFAPEGDRQLAENFFAAIKGVLATNLSVISNQ
jgi:hypothetical protein